MPADLLQSLLDDIAQGAVELDEAITELADGDRARELASLIGVRTSIDVSAVVHALSAHSHEPIAMLCRAAGMSVNGYSAILRMRRRCGQSLDESFSSLASAYLARPKYSRELLVEALRRSEDPATASS